MLSLNVGSLPLSLLPLFIFFDMNLCAVLHRVLAGETAGWLGIGGRRAVLVVRRQLDALLVHALGLHPLD